MPQSLHKFRHTETRYLRPNQAWTCGRECDGAGCALGPDAKGRCRANFVMEGACHPAPTADGNSWNCTRSVDLGGPCQNGPKKDGSCCLSRKSGECVPILGQYNKITGETGSADRWFCTRDGSCGGPCEDGPLPDGSCCRQLIPCKPVASLRRKRGMFAILTSAVTLAILLILFSEEPKSPEHALNPGPISATHSTADIACAHCHANSGVSLESLLDFHSDAAMEDGRLCLKCHGEIGGPEEAHVFAAHTLPAEHLAKLTAKARRNGNANSQGTASAMLRLTTLVAAKDQKSEIACAACHKEHRGKHVDLKEMSNAQCQVCHTDQFHSFTKGHPEFTAYPSRRKTRIFFDHASHFDEYFLRAEVRQFAKKACTDCHSEDVEGAMMLTGSFESSCRDCHDSKTRLGAMELVSFPKMKAESLADFLGDEEEKRLARWGKGSGKEMGPLLRLLLADSDEDTAQAIRSLDDAGLTLWKLRKASQPELEAAGTIAAAVLNKVYADNPDGLKKLLLDSSLLKDADSGIRRRLGENLAGIFADLRNRADPASEKPLTLTTDFGGVFTYNAEEGGLSYQPGGHADPLMKALLDVSAAMAGTNAHAKALFGEASSYYNGSGSASAGRCIQCHTVSENEDGSYMVNWDPAAPGHRSRPITRFAHRSHIRLPELVRAYAFYSDEACAACHFLERSEPYLNEYRAQFSSMEENPRLLDPWHFRSGFRSISLDNCATCHTGGQAGNDCLLCHNYHATPQPLPILTRLLAPDSPDKADAPEEDPDGPKKDDGGGDSLVPGTEGDSLVPDGAGDSLVPEGEGDSLVPEGEGDSLIPGTEGDSLVPSEEGDSLIPSEGGESLIPDGGDDAGDGESLLPE